MSFPFFKFTIDFFGIGNTRNPHRKQYIDTGSQKLPGIEPYGIDLRRNLLLYHVHPTCLAADPITLYRDRHWCIAVENKGAQAVNIPPCAKCVLRQPLNGLSVFLNMITPLPAFVLLNYSTLSNSKQNISQSQPGV